MPVGLAPSLHRVACKAVPGLDLKQEECDIVRHNSEAAKLI